MYLRSRPEACEHVPEDQDRLRRIPRPCEREGLAPPLDAVLLKALDSSVAIDRDSDLKVFQGKLAIAKALGKTWTTFDRSTYDAYIAAIRVFQGSQPLWAVERLWSPEREALPV